MSECVCGTSSTLMHNVCTLQKLDPIHYCIYFARDFVDEVVITEQYGTEVGLAALEWLDIHTTDDPLEEWLTNVIALILDKWTSLWLSSCGGRLSVLPVFECMWWQDRCSYRLSSQWLGIVRWQDRVLPKVESLWWQDKRSGIIDPFQYYRANFFPVGFYHYDLVDRIMVKQQNGHSEGEVGERTSSSLSLWHRAVQQF